MTSRNRFTRRGAIVTIGQAFSLTQIGALGFGADLDAANLMELNYLTTRFRSSRGSANLRLIAPGAGDRVRRIQTLSLLSANGVDSSRLTWFTEPSDVKGLGTLLVEKSDGEDDIWVYLPSLRQTRRIQASNKGDAFLGTDFSYGDVLGYRVNEWIHVVRG